MSPSLIEMDFHKWDRSAEGLFCGGDACSDTRAQSDGETRAKVFVPGEELLPQR